jgi:hypothetical protein
MVLIGFGSAKYRQKPRQYNTLTQAGSEWLVVYCSIHKLLVPPGTFNSPRAAAAHRHQLRWRVGWSFSAWSVEIVRSVFRKFQVLLKGGFGPQAGGSLFALTQGERKTGGAKTAEVVMVSSVD